MVQDQTDRKDSEFSIWAVNITTHLRTKDTLGVLDTALANSRQRTHTQVAELVY